MKNFLLVNFLFLFAITSLNAQNKGLIKGFVFDQENSSPIDFATVVVKDGDKPIKSVYTNEKGYFVLDELPRKSLTVEVTFIGYESYSRKVNLNQRTNQTLQVYLIKGTEILKSVDVTAEKQERKTKVLTGVVSLSPKKIQQFSVGGDADIIKAIQVLPGVVTTGDQGGQMYIRGGAPVQNLMLLDGMILYNATHSIGFFSVFDSDIIETADVYSGGFNADYGSRTSAVVDVKTRNGNKERLAGKVSASTYTAKALVEAPFGNKNARGKAPMSLLLSYKTSYLDQTSPIFYDYIDTEYDGLPFTFTDVYGKFNAQGENGTEGNLFGFSFQDQVKFGGDNDINWNTFGVGGNFLAVPAMSKVLIGGRVNYSQYDISALQGGDLSTSSIGGINGGLDFTYFIGKNSEFKYGVDIITYETETTIATATGEIDGAAENTTELAGYARYRWSADRLILEPSVRGHYYSSQSEFRFEPRIGAKYNVNEWMRLKASGGFYSQNILASYSDQEIVNLFYGFLSGLNATDLPATFNGNDVTSTLQLAQHVVAGVEFEVTDELTLNIEGYIKDFNQITNINRNKLYEETPENSDIDDVYKKDYILERGLSQGIDLLAKYQSQKWYIWLAYSISKNTRDDDVQEYRTIFDRTHNMNFLCNYQVDKEQTWEVSFRYNFGTGFPFTPTQAYYQQQPFLGTGNQPSSGYSYTTSNGQPGILYGDLNSERLPNYHRVDISVTKNIEFSKTSILTLTAGATNILNYENIFYFDRNDVERVNQLPIMPTVSVAYSF